MLCTDLPLVWQTEFQSADGVNNFDKVRESEPKK